MRRTRRHSSIPIGLGVWLASLAAVGGCSGLGELPDGGQDGAPPDARVVDGPMLVDAASDGGAFDGGVADGGVADGRADAGASCFGMCDPSEGSGCGVRGVCVLSEGEPRCEPSVGGIAAGEPCESTTDCAPGLACFQSRDSAVCRAVCCPGAEGACGGEGRCREGDLVDGTSPDWGMCLPPRACDVLRPEETCEPGEACYIISPDAETDCRPAGTAEVGDACEKQNDCAPGLFCGGLSEPTCVRICSTGDAGTPTCPAGEGDCVVYSQSPPGTGLCTVTDTG